MLPKIADAVENVKKAKAAELAKLGGDEYTEFLGALVTEAEGWKAELDERTGKTPSKEPEPRTEPGTDETAGEE